MVSQVLILKMFNGYTMSSNVTRDHHNLRRNLKLNSNYISNDGGDEGISIADDGTVSISTPTTTGTALEIATTTQTNGRALSIDVNDSTTTAATKAVAIIEYDKSGVTSDGHLSQTTGLEVSLNDAATNHAGGNVLMRGVTINIDSASAQGNIYKTGLLINVAADSVGDAANTTGLSMRVMDGATDIKLQSSADPGDYFSISTTTAGATTLATVDDDGADAHLTLAPDGDLVLDPDSQKIIINATDDLYFDGGTETYITEGADDILSIIVGADVLLQLSEFGTNGNEALFKASCATFTRLEQTYSTTDVIGSAGAHDTDIDFRHSNKYRLEMTGDVTTMNLIFPIGSGNFVLVCTTNGDHDVTNWKAWEYDETAATTADVLWAGGSVPAFTNNGIDIVSFYWDSVDQQAYGVASLAFATP